VVYLAESRTTHAKFAVKPFKLRGITDGRRKELRNEAEICLTMDHPHVARLADIYEHPGHLEMVMECLEGGELLDRIHECQLFTERHAADMTWQMLLAVNYLHRMGIAHRDIKPENFMYDKKGSEHLKLIDFGFSRFWNPSRKMQVSCGTLPYCSPEVLAHDYTDKCDLWSLGVVVFILLMGYMPFDGSQQVIISQIQACSYRREQGRWERLSESAKDFVTSLLELDPDKRLSAAQAIAHSWVETRQRCPSDDEPVDPAVVNSLRKYAQASRFRRICMCMMAWSLTISEQSQVRAAFVDMDLNRSGFIELFELRDVIKERLKLPEAEIQHLFKILDCNQDERVHYSEFLAAMMSSRITLHDELIAAAFNRFDMEGTGYITSNNLAEVLGHCCPAEEVAQLINEADFDSDGCINLEEFMVYIRGDAPERHQEVACRLIDSELRKMNLRRSSSRASECVFRAWESGEELARVARMSRACILQ